MTAPAARLAAPSGLRAFVGAACATPLDAILTGVVAAFVVVVAAIPLTRWAIIDAVWTGTADDCRAASGACWTFVGHKLGFVLFGLYPPAERWRAAIALCVLVALIVITAMPRFWRRWILGAWALGLVAAFWLMHGGAGLARRPDATLGRAADHADAHRRSGCR